MTCTCSPNARPYLHHAGCSNAPEEDVADHLFAVLPDSVATTNDDWYTPKWIFDAASIEFDMDVAAPIDKTFQHVPAKRYLTAVDDGLTSPWVGTVWCNPPYSGSTPWVEKWAAHNGSGLLLVPAVKSRWVGAMLNAADAITLLTVEFQRPGGQVAPIRWLNILASKGPECAGAVARIAAMDRHAAGGFLVRSNT